MNHRIALKFSEAADVHQGRTVCPAARYSHLALDDSGAITIDWVGLSAGVILAGMVAIFAIFGNGVSVVTTNVDAIATGLASDLDPGPVVQQNP